MQWLALPYLFGALHCRWGFTDPLLLGLPPPPTSNQPDSGQLSPDAGGPRPGAVCGDTSRDGGTEADCGVPVCLTCPDAAACEADINCGSCSSGECPSRTCSDGIQNGGETRIDCGGACPACVSQPECSVGAECASGVCLQGSCQASICSDGVQNAGETSADCGGPCGATCLDGSGCASAGDCISRVCADNACQAPTCADGVHNQGETDVDCGGSCGPCIDTSDCSAPGDCASQVCTGNICQAPTCSDSVRNRDETSVDCGGASCAPCPCTFGTPQVLGNPNLSGAEVWAPTLSSDGLTMYLSITPSGSGEQIAITTRPNRSNPFGATSLLPSPVNAFVEGTPELSEDGLSLYFFSQRFGGTGDRDLYVATRSSASVQFNAVSNLTTVNSGVRDDRPWVSPDELTVYFASQRASGSDDLWRATRTVRTGSFGTPVAVTELNSIGNDAGVSLTPDGKVAFFASDRSGGAGGVDLYRAVRASTSTAFSVPQRIAALSSSADDIDPQLTADGQELFFASNRSTGSYRIWRSLVTCP